jgi:hypothetical protein
MGWKSHCKKYETRGSIIVFAKVHYSSLSLVRLMQSTSYFIKIPFNIILKSVP